MTEYRVVWQQCPHVQFAKRILFVEAPSEKDAVYVARDHIERTLGIGWFSIHEAVAYQRPQSGRVVGAE